MSGIFGGIGKLEFAPTNGPDDPFPTWVDITQYVRADTTSLVIRNGRQNELDTIQAGQLTCLLDNTDFRFTPGYTGGPYGANFTAGKQIRYTETIRSRTFAEFYGFIEAPDTPGWLPQNYQEVQLSAVDRLARLGRSAPYPSTLGGHILGSPSASSLVGYWPMNDLMAPFTPWSGTLPQAAAGLAPIQSGFTATVTPQGIAGPPGDDASAPLWATTDPNYFSYREYTSVFSSPLVVPNGQTIALATWVRPQASPPSSSSAGSCVIIESHSGSGDILFDDYGTLQAGDGGIEFGSYTGMATHTAPYPRDTWRLITVRVTTGTGAVDLWCGSDLVASATASPVPTSLSFDDVLWGFQWAGAIAHTQIYVGVNAFPRSEHLAQFQVGLTGLEGQTTGQRISSLLSYAGIPATKTIVDLGSSPMQVATLAGATVKSQLDLAVGTEQGRGFIDGNDKYVFQGRPYVYNV